MFFFSPSPSPLNCSGTGEPEVPLERDLLQTDDLDSTKIEGLLEELDYRIPLGGSIEDPPDSEEYLKIMMASCGITTTYGNLLEKAKIGLTLCSCAVLCPLQYNLNAVGRNLRIPLFAAFAEGGLSDGNRFIVVIIF